MGEKLLLRASTRGDDELRLVAPRTIYATIIVNGHYRLAEQRLHTDRTNWTLLILLQTPVSETADYTVAQCLCQAQPGISVS